MRRDKARGEIGQGDKERGEMRQGDKETRRGETRRLNPQNFEKEKLKCHNS